MMEDRKKITSGVPIVISTTVSTIWHYDIILHNVIGLQLGYREHDIVYRFGAWSIQNVFRGRQTLRNACS